MSKTVLSLVVLFCSSIFNNYVFADQYIDTFVGKVVYNKQKYVFEQGVRKREYVLRVRNIKKGMGNIQTLRLTVSIDSELDLSIRKIIDDTHFGYFETYKRGFDEIILEAKPVTAQYKKISSQNSKNGYVDEQKEPIILIIDRDKNASMITDREIEKSYLFGNTGVKIGK